MRDLPFLYHLEPAAAAVEFSAVSECVRRSASWLFAGGFIHTVGPQNLSDVRELNFPPINASLSLKLLWLNTPSIP